MAKTPPKPKKTKDASPAKSSAPSAKLPSGFRIFVSALSVLRANWRVFLGVILIYAFLNILLVQGFNLSSSLEGPQATLSDLLSGNWNNLGGGFAVFLFLISSSAGTSDPVAGLYQMILILIISLALIWALRQLYAGHKIGVRDSFYRGMTPLIQFVLVLLVIFVQLLPMAIGLTVFNALTTSGLVTQPWEKLLGGGMVVALSLTSLYLLGSSLFAAYIVTLPDMTPMRALRSARNLVAKRRWLIMRKILFLPLILMIFATVLVLPVILLLAPVASWVFLVATLLFLPLAHSYMYALYRSLL